MCWQDIRIARQTTPELIRQFDADAELTQQLPHNLRRTKIILTGLFDATAAASPPQFTIYLGTSANIARRIFSQNIINQTVIDIHDYGDLLTQALFVVFQAGDTGRITTMVVSQLADPYDEGNIDVNRKV